MRAPCAVAMTCPTNSNSARSVGLSRIAARNVSEPRGPNTKSFADKPAPIFIRILFSRSFGGAVSLLMEVGAEHLGRGLIHAKLSHKLAEYCDKRRTVNKRTIELSYIPEGEKLLQLERTSLGASQAANWLISAMECNDRIASEMVSHLGETADRFCIVALEQPGVKFLHTHIFLSYLNNQHPAHSAFHQLRRDPASTFTLDWDCDPTVSNTNNPDYPLQWLFYNSIGANFFRQCSLLWQEKRRTGDPSPWPGGVLTPPFAQQVNLTSNVPYHGV
jgi:hypothetical protein